MLLTDWNKKSIKKQLEVVQLDAKPIVHIPNEVLKKIQYLCKSIPRVEWSGILFYTMNGSVKEPKKLKIILQDILPMNKGTQAYTEYEYDDRMIEFLMEDPERMKWKVGHIHSHNTMPVFFSGTDMEELNENSSAHNFYLSLIVNNFMDFSAKIGTKANLKYEVKQLPYNALDENGESYTIQQSDFTLIKEKVFIYDCTIKVKLPKIDIDYKFSNSVERIIVDEQNKVLAEQHRLAEIQRQRTKQPPSKLPVIKSPRDIDKHFVDAIPYENLQNIIFDDDEIITDMDLFVVALLRGTNPADDEVPNIDVALDELMAFKPDPIELSKEILANYIPLYENYFEKESYNSEFFMMTTQEVIDIFEESEIEYPFLSTTIMALKYMLQKYEENGTT